MSNPTIKIWSRGDILGLVEASDLAAMRAVCAIFRRQTEDEKRDETTRHDNSRGFSQAHAKVGSELALWMTGGKQDGVLRRRVGGKFPGKWIHAGVRDNGKNVWKKNTSAFSGRDRVEVCRDIARRYTRQLVEIANGEMR
jgi:hypothetical protein